MNRDVLDFFCSEGIQRCIDCDALWNVVISW